jgi:hypothetical protein
MLHYRDGRPVHVGDHVVHGTAAAIVEQIIEGDEVTSWDLKEPGFMLVCDECGRVLTVVSATSCISGSEVEQSFRGGPDFRLGQART